MGKKTNSGSKITIYFASIKDVQAIQEKLQPSKEKIQHFKT
jgi:hypothetical protein